MKKILDKLRKRPRLYEFFKKIYGNTIGLWWLKELYIRYIGFYNGEERLKMLGPRRADLLIAKKIKSGEPFMLARYGSTEFRNLFSKQELGNLCHYSGFFPNDKKLLDKFRKIYFEASKSMDILVVWNYTNHFLKKIKLLGKLPNLKYLIHFFAIDPFDRVWLNELKGKRVLVVHPFKNTIEAQYKKQNKIGLLPKFKSFRVIKAVQTLAGNKDERFETWFDALEYMKKEIAKEDFDIALIGCGAYGLPLAAYVKSLGKQGLHIGGGLQLFFGIKGKRWDEKSEFNSKYNKYWVHPMKEDFFETCKKVEGGCYW